MSTNGENLTSLLHHDAQKSYQVAFHKDVKSMEEAIEEFGNPFQEESQDLFVLDSKVVADVSSATRRQKIESIGREQYKKFVADCLDKRNVPLNEPISKNKLDFFSTVAEKKLSRKDKHFSSIKKDCSLFSRLYIACQTREGDLDEFFKYENQGYPPPLADQGSLRLPRKSLS